MSKRVFFILLIFSALFYWFFIIPENRIDSDGSEGRIAPDFTLKNEEGAKVSLSALKGKVVLVHFWATWCSPCVAEFPTLNVLYQKMPKDHFVILAISQDEEGKRAIDVFRKKVPFDFSAVLDPKQDISDLYGTYRLPETYLVNKEGMIVKKFIGPQDWSQPKIQEKIKQILLL